MCGSAATISVIRADPWCNEGCRGRGLEASVSMGDVALVAVESYDILALDLIV